MTARPLTIGDSANQNSRCHVAPARSLLFNYIMMTTQKVRNLNEVKVVTNG